MSRHSQSADFSTEHEDIWTVQRLNQAVARTIETTPALQNIWLEGEISNLNYHTSGHIYFSLKDERSAISCTFFRGSNRNLKVKLENGMMLLVYGGVSVYQVRGNYQFNVQRVSLSGEGELRIRIEQLKKKLAEEGLFSPERKKRIPLMPLNIGVATAATGAAIQDIIRVSRTRFPDINILLSPCLVQGEGAVNSIVSAIHALQDPRFGIDVIIAGRGGGSFEDLMPFNEEPVVRAFAECTIPIVSAVGHQIDHPLTDLAADAYAATPSAAAELVVPLYDHVMQRLDETEIRLARAVEQPLRYGREQLNRISESRVHTRPESILEPFFQSVDIIWKDINHQMKNILLSARNRMDTTERFVNAYEKSISRKRNMFNVLSERLENFSPLGTLKRGFAIARRTDGTVIRRATDVKKGDTVEVLPGSGRITAIVESVQKEL